MALIKSILIFGGLAAAMAAVTFMYWPSLNYAMLDTKEIAIDSSRLMVEVADTPQEREQGLSGHSPLSSGEGMLFVFEEDGIWGIWMKDMTFVIDIVWLDAVGKVVTIAPNVAPSTYPTVFEPAAPARYVLELPSNGAEAYGLRVGSEVQL